MGNTKIYGLTPSLWISGVPSLPAGQGYTVTVGFSAWQGNPAINLYAAYETNGGTLYLTDTNVAAATLASPAHNQALTTLNDGSQYTFPDGCFDGGDKYFLFEGAGAGGGTLLLEIIQNGEQVYGTTIDLDLRDIKELYEQAHVEAVFDDVPSTSTALSRSDRALDDGSTEEPQFIVFVHGWRMGQWDYHSFSETMFKRLYWQGYRGRFAALRWPTLSQDDFVLPLLDLFTYNRSEFRAFQSGAALAAYLNGLRGRFPDYSINVAAHSMGGIVTMEGLRLQALAALQDADNAVLMQAAVPAHCFDAVYPNFTPLVNAETNSPTPDVYRGYPGNVAVAVRGSLMNFFNTNDFALATGIIPGINLEVHWEANQIRCKPDTGYLYDGTNCFQQVSLGVFRTVTDPREQMARVARPRSQAVGAVPGVGSTLATGAEVDLRATFGLDTAREDHSAQFNWNNHRAVGFYEALLEAFFGDQP
jgi:pimeloyl-ACP methyl ester carboxylesterase